MMYSAMVCPFRRTAGGRLGPDATWRPGAPRGEHASIMGFERHDVLFDTTLNEIGGSNCQQFPFLYIELRDEIVVRDPLAELAGRYDRERIDVGGRYRQQAQALRANVRGRGAAYERRRGRAGAAQKAVLGRR